MTEKPSYRTKTEKKRYVEAYKKMSARLNFNGFSYLTIFTNAVKRYKIHEKEAEELYETSQKNGTIALLWFVDDQQIRIKMVQDELVAITFAAMYLECVIWDYAAVNTTKNLTENLEKISLLGKWNVIPGLVNNNKSISIGQKAIALLKKLVKERNNIVHSKSKAVPDTYDEIKEIENKKPAITLSETVECVHECIKGLQKIDATNYWYFEEAPKHTVKFPTSRVSKKKGTTPPTS